VVFQLLPPPAIRALAKFVQVSYSTGWLMLNKLPKAMAERNGLYKLGGNIQVDEFFLGGESHGEG
ncbi:unnamed protein product, partial [Acidithrix sp. C25]